MRHGLCVGRQQVKCALQRDRDGQLMTNSCIGSTGGWTCTMEDCVSNGLCFLGMPELQLVLVRIRKLKQDVACRNHTVLAAFVSKSLRCHIKLQPSLGQKKA